jgi:hypothetical protein
MRSSSTLMEVVIKLTVRAAAIDGGGHRPDNELREG